MNKEVIKWLNKNRACVSMTCNKENADKINLAIDEAIKALYIVDAIENGFKRDGNLMMDSDDWEDIKKFVEKEAEE